MTQATRTRLAKLCGITALLGTAIPPTLFMTDLMPHEQMKMVMLGAAVLWFASAPFWMKVE